MEKEKLDFDSLRLAVKHKRFSPVYVFYGNEEFLIEESIKSILYNAVEDGVREFNFDVVYGNEVEVQNLISLLLLLPVMSPKRVVVMRNSEKFFNKISRSKKEKEAETFINYLKRPNPDTIFIIVLNEPDFEKEIYKKLFELAEVVELKAPYDWQIPSWIAKRVVELGKTPPWNGKEITSEACKLLQAYVGNSLRELDNEIKKLFIFTGEKKKIDAEDVKQAVGLSRNFTVFDLQRAIGEKNLQLAIIIVERMLQAGEFPAVILTMLTRYFSTLWKLHELRKTEKDPKKLANSLMLSPYHIREYLNQLDKFKEEEIKNAFKYLIEADELIKTSPIDSKIVLSQMVYKIITE
ncbi:DNA polymerase III, delta subunit [Candidatus Kryptobacter tengchongensis]|uniref:DNA polymerase III subunit delta n=1 Tax=Kryptobacter tengchongensis TaxID=1643429 RepID=A0A916LIR8_KRYT1|nr:DNA polymerase III subunit delta [Candidatus Kryptobacter tengchongensis]CUS98114.1 DNA polymerase III, delta subunit [Candidatus Kryptobacter tengchongensis]CUU10031.1 DNA polymerase III, delta subunit [Candidatus Kryptobacter tengchongensis]